MELDFRARMWVREAGWLYSRTMTRPGGGTPLAAPGAVCVAPLCMGAAEIPSASRPLPCLNAACGVHARNNQPHCTPALPPRS